LNEEREAPEEEGARGQRGRHQDCVPRCHLGCAFLCKGW
jgi:hypothetical protein